MARPKTGKLQFGDDWEGTFIRGDAAFGYANALQNALRDLASPGAEPPFTSALGIATLQDLLQLFSSSTGVQRLKSFDACCAEQEE